MLFDRLAHGPYLGDGFAQPVSRYAKLLAPIAQFVVLIDVDALVILPAGLLQIVCHKGSFPWLAANHVPAINSAAPNL